MTDTTPADRPADQLRDRLRAAAQRALESLDSLIADHQDPGAEALGARYELARELSNSSPEVARQLLGGEAEGRPSPTTVPLAEVWTVWRENEPVYAHYTTVDDARQGTIDCWREDEPSCPDYSWRQDGTRLELVVGGEPGGVYASRHRVYGAPPAPADRAAVLREAAEVAVRAARACGESETGQYAASVAAGIGRDLRRLADDAAAGVQPPTTCEAHHTTTQWVVEVYDPRSSTWVSPTRFHTPEVAAAAVKDYEKTTPTWTDGSPVQRRIVRATTTYTVEPEPAAPVAPEEPQ